MKRNLFLFLIFSTIIFSCNNSSDNANEDVIYESVTDTVSSANLEDSATTIFNSPSIWTVQLDSTTSIDKLKKPADTKIQTMSATQIISELNQQFSDIPLEYLTTSQDTVYVKVPEEQRLTNQIGSTGAYNYMATVVYNLTEMKNIKVVNFKFKEGDHAFPGSYSREDFKKLR